MQTCQVRDDVLVDSHLTRHQKSLLLFCQSSLFLFFFKHLDCCQTQSYFQLQAPLLCKYTSSAPSPHRPHNRPDSKNSSRYSSFLFLLIWIVADSAGLRRPALWPLILFTLHGGFRVRPQSQRPLPAAPVLISTSRHTGSTHPPLPAP